MLKALPSNPFVYNSEGKTWQQWATRRSRSLNLRVTKHCGSLPSMKLDSSGSICFSPRTSRYIFRHSAFQQRAPSHRRSKLNVNYSTEPFYLRRSPLHDFHTCQIDARMHLDIAKVWESCTKSISFSILTIRHHHCIFTTHNPVSSLIKKHHSSHLGRIQLRDMALKAQPWSLSPPHIKGALSTEPRL